MGFFNIVVDPPVLKRIEEDQRRAVPSLFFSLRLIKSIDGLAHNPLVMENLFTEIRRVVIFFKRR